MDVILTILNLIGIAGVVIIILGIFGYIVLHNLTTYKLNRVSNDTDDDTDPDGGMAILKTPDTAEVSGVFLCLLI
jgi:hypothetical protein